MVAEINNKFNAKETAVRVFVIHLHNHCAADLPSVDGCGLEPLTAITATESLSSK